MVSTTGIIRYIQRMHTALANPSDVASDRFFCFVELCSMLTDCVCVARSEMERWS